MTRRRSIVEFEAWIDEQITQAEAERAQLGRQASEIITRLDTLLAVKAHLQQPHAEEEEER